MDGLTKRADGLLGMKGSIQTEAAGRDWRKLYARWQSGRPAVVDLLKVHGPEVQCFPAALRNS
jgi:hypothetical protein